MLRVAGQCLHILLCALCSLYWRKLCSLVVSLCTVACGQFMHRRLWSVYVPSAVTVCLYDLFKTPAIISLYGINWLLFIMEAHCFLCEILNESLRKMLINFNFQRVGWNWVVFDFVKLLFVVANICCTNMLLNVSCVLECNLMAVKCAYRAALVLPSFLILGPLLFLTTIN